MDYALIPVFCRKKHWFILSLTWSNEPHWFVVKIVRKSSMERAKIIFTLVCKPPRTSTIVKKSFGIYHISDGPDIRFSIRYPVKSGHFQLSGIRPVTGYQKTGYPVFEYPAGYPANRILIRHFYSCLNIWDVSIIWVTVEQRTGIAPRSYFAVYLTLFRYKPISYN